MDVHSQAEKGLSPSIPRISVDGPPRDTDNSPEPIQDSDKNNNNNGNGSQQAKSRPGLLGLASVTPSALSKRKSNTLPPSATHSPLSPTTDTKSSLRRVKTDPVTGTVVDPNADVDRFKWKTLLHPKKRVSSESPSLITCFRNIITYSYLNVLLLFIPIGWAMHFAHLSDTLVFVFTFVAIIPLAALLGFATEELALRVGPTLGGLLNATFGNAVELIIAIIALKQNQLRIVQASMLGSFLSNTLLVLGMCFFAGGLRFHEQSYGATIAQQQISLLSLSVFSVVVPAAFVASGTTGVDQNGVLAISRGTAVVLLIVYAAYLIFQLFTHKYLYTLEASKRNARVAYETGSEGVTGPEKGQKVFRVPSILHRTESKEHGHHGHGHGHANGVAEAINPLEGTNAGATITTKSDETAVVAREKGEHQVNTTTNKKTDEPVVEGKGQDDDDEVEEQPQLKVIIAVLLLVVITVLTGVTAEFLVSSINGMTEKSHVNKEFVALILLPLVGNAAEHVTAVTVSVKNKLDLAMGVAIGSSIQIFLFVLPFMVVLAWGLEKPLTLNFDIFETVIVTLAIIVVSYAIADGKTNWLEGFVLMVLYIIIAIATWFHQDTSLNST